jgi:translation initiation factor IF-2
MSENKAIRLSKIAREFNVGISTIVDFLQKKGHKVDPNPNTKIEADLYSLLLKEYSSDLDVKKKSESFSLQNLREKKEILSPEKTEEVPEPEEEAQLLIKDTSASHPDSEARKDRQIEEKQQNLLGQRF